MIGLDVDDKIISVLKIDPTDRMNFKEFVVALSLVYMVKVRCPHATLKLWEEPQFDGFQGMEKHGNFKHKRCAFFSLKPHPLHSVTPS